MPEAFDLLGWRCKSDKQQDQETSAACIPPARLTSLRETAQQGDRAAGNGIEWHRIEDERMIERNRQMIIHLKNE